MTVSMRWFVLVLALVGGCKRPMDALTPEQTYRQFLANLERGQAKQAWALLSAPTKERVTARSKELVAASKGVVRDEPEVLLFQGSRPGAVASITQVRADETSATLEVTVGSGKQEIKLVRDSGKWLIELSDTL